MYLYSRTRTADTDRLMDATAFAVDITETVNSKTDLGLQAWSAVYGAPVGTFAWTATVPSMAAMGAIGEKLLADPSYLAKVEEARGIFTGPIEDMVVDMVAMAGEGGHTGDYASLVTAQVAGGHAAEAMAWGVDILNHVSGLTGRDGVFGRSMFGPWGSVGWISLAASLDEVDAASEAMAADADYLAKVDAAGALFVPGASSSRLTRRIA